MSDNKSEEGVEVPARVECGVREMEPESRERGWICSFLGSGSTVAFMHLFFAYVPELPLIRNLELTVSIYLDDLEY